MTDNRIPPSSLSHQRFYQAEQEAGFAEEHPRTSPQQQDPSYRLAFHDADFLLRQELRPVRFQLELLKPEMLLDEAGIASTLVVYGSARIPAPEARAFHVGETVDLSCAATDTHLLERER